jgi:hypothetical protein
MATATQIIDKAFRLFDEETDSKYEQDGDRTTALELLNDGYFEICLETLCSRTNATITTTPGTNGVDFPNGFIAVLEVAYNDGYRYLDPIFESDVAVNKSGCPTGYVLTGTQFKFNVTPDAAYSYLVDYYTGPTADLTLTETPTLIPEIWQLRVLPHYVLWQLFAIDKREEISARAPLWRAHYENQLNKMASYFSGEKRYAGRSPELG